MIVTLCKRPGLSLAAAALLMAVACQPQDVSSDLDYHRGCNALAMARYDWARSYFAADLEHNPERAESLRGLGLGWISGYEGSLTNAIKSFEHYLELVPEDANIRLRLAKAWLRAGERQKSLNTIKDWPRSRETDLLSARALMSEAPQAALGFVESVLSEAPKSFEAHHIAAQIHDQLGDSEPALVATQRAAELNPLSAELFYRQAQVLRRLGRLEESAEALANYELVSQLPGPGLTMAPAQELVLMRQIGARLKPSSLTFQTRLARLCLETGDISTAQALIEQIEADSETDDAARLSLARTAHTHHQTSIARSLYERILERDPQHVEALSSAARLALETHKLENAQHYLDLGLTADPHHGPLNFTSGLLALAEEDTPRAVNALETAVALVPWLPRFRLTLADVYLTQGDLESLDALLQAAPGADPAIEAYVMKHSL